MKKKENIEDEIEEQLIPETEEEVPTDDVKEEEETPSVDEQKARQAIHEIAQELTSEKEDLKMQDIFRKVLAGDLLTYWLRKEFLFIIIVSFLVLIYIGNRYTYQQQLIEIETLNDSLSDAKSYALTRSSELMERTRQSHIEESLRLLSDTTLHISSTPPYTIIKDDNNQ